MRDASDGVRIQRQYLVGISISAFVVLATLLFGTDFTLSRRQRSPWIIRNMTSTPGTRRTRSFILDRGSNVDISPLELVPVFLEKHPEAARSTLGEALTNDSSQPLHLDYPKRHTLAQKRGPFCDHAHVMARRCNASMSCIFAISRGHFGSASGGFCGLGRSIYALCALHVMGRCCDAGMPCIVFESCFSRVLV